MIVVQAGVYSWFGYHSLITWIFYRLFNLPYTPPQLPSDLISADFIFPSLSTALFVTNNFGQLLNHTHPPMQNSCPSNHPFRKDLPPPRCCDFGYARAIHSLSLARPQHRTTSTTVISPPPSASEPSPRTRVPTSPQPDESSRQRRHTARAPMFFRSVHRQQLRHRRAKPRGRFTGSSNRWEAPSEPPSPPAIRR